ncbi:MAG: hypothetical protein ACRC50_07685, partial [Gaiella sp.]
MIVTLSQELCAKYAATELVLVKATARAWSGVYGWVVAFENVNRTMATRFVTAAGTASVPGLEV